MTILEWVNFVTEDKCNPSRTESLPTTDPIYVEKYIKEFSATCVYTHRASREEPLTEKIRKSMSENVKSTAYNNLLDQNNKLFGNRDGEFVDENQQILNFARDDVHKNTSTKKPARLNEQLAVYYKSIAKILCGSVCGTCWLVSERLVITNFHIYMMINKEREDTQNPNLPIYAIFDFLKSGQEDFHGVKIDEKYNPNIEYSQLDYIFLHLNENERLNGRVPLGRIVRSRPLEEGLVIITGHPGGEEMLEETCVVVSKHSWREKLNVRQGVHTSVYMTNEELLEATDMYKECLPYDTSHFCGSSGSPVFDLNGNIVAMHAQGYVLPISKKRKYSLMEFGLQFNAICEDIKRKHGENVVRNLFPFHNLAIDEVPMEEDNS